MSILSYFKRGKKASATVARDRLQIIVARNRSQSSGRGRDYLPMLHQELVQVIAKYETIDPDQVIVSLDDNGDGCEVLELNITLPETPELSEFGKEASLKGIDDTDASREKQVSKKKNKSSKQRAKAAMQQASV